MDQPELKQTDIEATGYQPYPEYCDSGVEWFGDIPAHWQMRRLKTIAQIMPSNVDKKSQDGETPIYLCNYTDVYYNERITPDIEFMKATATASQIAKFRLRAGDVIITKDSETADDIAVPAYVPDSFSDVICGYHLALIRPRKHLVDGNYLFRSFMANPISDQFEVGANGVTRFGLPQSAIKDAWFLMPPLQEQRAIASFLDRETAKIDALIAKKERFIELLQEKRSAIISHAVTKGLDPDAPMKDSGVEWLGEIPEHWEIRRLKYLIEFLTSGSRGWAQYYADDGELFIRIGNISGDSLEIDLSDVQHVLPPHGAEALRTRLKLNDVLISATANVGSIAIVDETVTNGYINQHIFLTRPRINKVVPEWLGYLLKSGFGQVQFDVAMYGGTKDGLNFEDAKSLNILLPPIDEQQLIVSYIKQHFIAIQNVIDSTLSSIELLEEQRSALISTAVTGKIDVRGTGS
jgi:type I restriction enzyme S subunit